ncbi:hypothetical protein MMC11_006332 [Xylographa trunciseda]|nr:hypothetical protein [Xylographa trunciseda]
MSVDRLVNRAIKSAKVGMLSRLQSISPDHRTILLKFLLIDTHEVRIKTLMDGPHVDFARYSSSIFAPRPSADDEIRGGSIGNGILLEAAQIFYGDNKFVADDVADLLWFANHVEPGCHRYVRHLILSDGVFARNSARDTAGLCLEEYQMMEALQRFPGLEGLIFSLTWDFGSIDSWQGHVLLNYCHINVVPTLQWMTIARMAAEPAFLSVADRTQYLSEDSRLVLRINGELKTRFWGNQRMQF